MDPAFDCIEVIAIESRLDQRGKTKKYEGIAGCLLAFAARLAFANRHGGWVYLIAKTELAELYNFKYGFEYIGAINSLSPKMVSDATNSQRLIKQYLKGN